MGTGPAAWAPQGAWRDQLFKALWGKKHIAACFACVRARPLARSHARAPPMSSSAHRHPEHRSDSQENRRSSKQIRRIRSSETLVRCEFSNLRHRGNDGATADRQHRRASEGVERDTHAHTRRRRKERQGTHAHARTERKKRKKEGDRAGAVPADCNLFSASGPVLRGLDAKHGPGEGSSFPERRGGGRGCVHAKGKGSEGKGNAPLMWAEEDRAGVEKHARAPGERRGRREKVRAHASTPPPHRPHAHTPRGKGRGTHRARTRVLLFLLSLRPRLKRDGKICVFFSGQDPGPGPAPQRPRGLSPPPQEREGRGCRPRALASRAASTPAPATPCAPSTPPLSSTLAQRPAALGQTPGQQGARARGRAGWAGSAAGAVRRARRGKQRGRGGGRGSGAGRERRTGRLEASWD